jgi:HEAT repeat protein
LWKAKAKTIFLKEEEAATMIIPYVKDSSDRVRSSAIKFLIRINVPEAAPVFIEQLHEEDDCDNLEYLISGLVLWKQTDSLPLLRNILTSEWMENEEELKIVVNNAISNLEATKYEILSISQSN